MLLLFIAWNAYLAVDHLSRVQNVGATTLESSALQAKLAASLKDVTDMETGQRGYLLTGDPAYLQPYTNAKDRIGTDFVRLRGALAERSRSEQLLESQLESLTKSKQAEMERSISLRQQGYRRRSFNLVDTMRASYMDEIRRIASSLSSAEGINLARLDKERTSVQNGVLSVTIISNSVLLVLAVALFALSVAMGGCLEKKPPKAELSLPCGICS